MTTRTVNLVVKVPDSLRRRAKAIAHLRGETVSDVVRAALVNYVTTAEAMAADSSIDDTADAAFARTVLDRIAEGAPTYSHEEVWAEIERLEAAGDLPD